jgi:hypothetical protein
MLLRIIFGGISPSAFAQVKGAGKKIGKSPEKQIFPLFSLFLPGSGF